VFISAYLEDASSVANLLLSSTSPGAGWASSGDSGVYVGVANLPGRSYLGLETVVAVGPVADTTGSRSDASDKSNVVITLNGNLAGSCTDENGQPITASDTCVVPTEVIYATDPAGAIDSANPVDATVPSGFEAVSGVVTLRVGSAMDGNLPCATAGCTATLRVPVFETRDVSKLYQCFQVVDGKVVLSADAVATAASRDITAQAGSAPTFSCNVKQAGSYLVGKYPDPRYSAGVSESVYNNLTTLVSIAGMAKGRGIDDCIDMPWHCGIG
jgi:hypothetical protein